MIINRGDIFYIDRIYNEIGSEQYAGRPGIVVSANFNNEKSQCIEIVYLTTQPKQDLPTHVTIRSSNKLSTALCEQISTVSKDRVGNYLGTCTPQELENIDAALCISLGIKADPSACENKLTFEPLNIIVSEASAVVIAGLEKEVEVYKTLYNKLLDKLTN